MALVRDRSICLFRTEYSETSQILTLFSREHGIVRVIAKGAHRRTKAGASRFDGGIDLLETGEAVFTYDPERDLATLTDWKLLEGRLDLRRSLRAILLASYVAELVARLFEEHDPHPELFDRTQTLIAALAGPTREEAMLAGQLELLREAGYLPEWRACVSCNASTAGWSAAWFSPSRGGVVCHNCEAAAPDRSEVDVRLLRLVQGILAPQRSPGFLQRLPSLTRHQTDPLNRLLAEHVEHNLGRPLRTRRYIVRAAQATRPTSRGASSAAHPAPSQR